MKDKEKATELYPMYTNDSHLTAKDINFQNQIKRYERKAFVQGCIWKTEQILKNTKIFVVYNQALHHESLYNCILDIYWNEQEAINRVGCEYKDFCERINRGDFGSDFDEIEIDETMFPINPKNWDEYLVSTQGFYEAWRVEEHEIL